MQNFFDLPVAGRDLPLVMLPILHSLLKREEMLFSPRAAQRLFDALSLRLLNALVAKGQKLIGIPLSGQNRLDDPDPAITHQTANNIVQFDIHSFQSLLL